MNITECIAAWPKRGLDLQLFLSSQTLKLVDARECETQCESEISCICLGQFQSQKIPCLLVVQGEKTRPKSCLPQQRLDDGDPLHDCLIGMCSIHISSTLNRWHAQPFELGHQ